jgi:hypothetical protein
VSQAKRDQAVLLNAPFLTIVSKVIVIVVLFDISASYVLHILLNAVLFELH